MEIEAFLQGEPQSVLEQLMSPLRAWFLASDVNEILCNKPGAIWVERLGASMECHEVPALTEQRLDTIARHIAGSQQFGVRHEPPLLCSPLPNGDHIQIVMPPAADTIVFAVRRHSIFRDRTLADWTIANDAGEVRKMSSPEPTPAQNARAAVDRQLRKLLDEGQIDEFLVLALRHKSIAISGVASSGKTTMLTSLANTLPASARLISLTRDRGLTLSHSNQVSLRVPRAHLDETKRMADLVEAAHKLRPDWLIFDDLQGPEVYTFLRLIGQPGSIFTVRAGAPEVAFERLAEMLQENEMKNVDLGQITKHVRASVDIVIHVEGGGSGRRPGISRILFEPVEL